MIEEMTIQLLTPTTYPPEGAVGGLEIQDGRPVVGEVFLKRAGCAGRKGGKVVIYFHGDIESEG